jgi:predicted ATP-dependent protease
LLDVMFEADHLARRAQRAVVDGVDVSAAIAARRARASRVDDRHRDAMLRELLMIDTAGTRVGQVNGLTVYGIGDEMFGAPTRITATSRLGDGQVIDVQRETRLSGPVHAKGVLILSSFLASRYSRLRPHSIVASLVFEQTYGMVEGDSASLGELVALLSSIGDLPIEQRLAVTGSVNQFGDVQAVGGVDEKVEGFFDLCVARGLDGRQGVIVPEANVSQLMLRDDVVDAVRHGRFALYAVNGVDAALELLTGLPAGDPAQPRDDTANGRIARRLLDYTLLRRGEPRGPRRRPGPRAARGTPAGGPA